MRSVQAQNQNHGETESMPTLEIGQWRQITLHPTQTHKYTAKATLRQIKSRAHFINLTIAPVYEESHLQRQGNDER